MTALSCDSTQIWKVEFISVCTITSIKTLGKGQLWGEEIKRALTSIDLLPKTYIFHTTVTPHCPIMSACSFLLSLHLRFPLPTQRPWTTDYANRKHAVAGSELHVATGSLVLLCWLGIDRPNRTDNCWIRIASFPQ